MTTEQRTRVEVVRSGRWWAITVPELGRVFSQARRLDQVEDRAREALALLLDIPESEVGELEVQVTVPASAEAVLKELTAAQAAAAQAASETARIRPAAAQALRGEGLTLRDIGYLLGVSHERVHQML